MRIMLVLPCLDCWVADRHIWMWTGLEGHLQDIWNLCVHSDPAHICTINMSGECKRSHTACLHQQCLGGMQTVALSSTSSPEESVCSSPAVRQSGLNSPTCGFFCSVCRVARWLRLPLLLSFCLPCILCVWFILSFIVQKVLSQASVLAQEELLCVQVQIWCACGGGDGLRLFLCHHLGPTSPSFIFLIYLCFNLQHESFT